MSAPTTPTARLSPGVYASVLHLFTMNKYQLDCAAVLTACDGILISPSNFERFEEWLRFHMPELCFASDAEATAAVKQRRQRMRDAGYFERSLPQLPIDAECPF